VIYISRISRHKSVQICINITISSLNPYFGTENANDNRYKEDIVNLLQKNKGAERISLTCKDIAISGIVISRFCCIPLCKALPRDTNRSNNILLDCLKEKHL
jgi:hypothetical protein